MKRYSVSTPNFKRWCYVRAVDARLLLRSANAVLDGEIARINRNGGLKLMAVVNGEMYPVQAEIVKPHKIELKIVPHRRGDGLVRYANGN